MKPPAPAGVLAGMTIQQVASPELKSATDFPVSLKWLDPIAGECGPIETTFETFLLDNEGSFSDWDILILRGHLAGGTAFIGGGGAAPLYSLSNTSRDSRG